MFCTVVIVALVCFSIYWGTKGSGDEERIIVVVDPRTIDPIFRWNCTHAWSDSTISKAQCETAGCWYVPDDSAVTYDVPNVPECFYPYPNYGYKVRSAVKLMDAQGMTSLTLRLQWKDEIIPGIIEKLTVSVIVKATLVEILVQPDELNYSVFTSQSPVTSLALSTVTVEYGSQWFYLLLTSSSGTVLLDTRASPLVFIRQSLIQLTSVLDASYSVYNMNSDPYNMTYRSEIMDASSNESSYNVPAYIARKDSESFGVSFTGGEYKNEMYLTPRKSLTFTSWNASSLSLNVFLGPESNQVVQSMVGKVRGSVAVTPSLWMFQLSSVTNHDTLTYREVTSSEGAKYRMERALFPLKETNTTGLCLQSDGTWEGIARTLQDTLNANMLGLPFTGVCSNSDSCSAQSNVSISEHRLKLWLPYNELVTECNEGALHKDLQSAMELRLRLVPTWYALFWQSNQDRTGVIRLTSHSYPNDPTAVTFDTSLRQIMLRDIIIIPIAHLFTQGPITSHYYLPASERWYVSNGQQYISVESGQHSYTDYSNCFTTHCLPNQDQFFVKAGTVLLTSDVITKEDSMGDEGEESQFSTQKEDNNYHLTILLDGNNKARSVGDIVVTVDGSVTIELRGGTRDIVITRITIQDLKDKLTTPIPYKITYVSAGLSHSTRLVEGQIEYEDVDDSSSVFTIHHSLELNTAGQKTVTVVLETGIPRK